MTNDQNTPGGSSLVKKLSDVMKTVKRIPKRGRNDFHGYDYATEADIVDAIRDELAARNVMCIPRTVKQIRTNVERQTKQGSKTAMLLDLEMVFTFMDGDSGEVLECPWMGCGEDSGDKALYKAMTGADKYFLMKTFLIPTGDDPEKDTRKRPAEQKQHASTRPANQRPSEPTITPEQQQELFALVADGKLSSARAKELMRQVAGVEKSQDVPVSKFNDLKATIEAEAVMAPAK